MNNNFEDTAKRYKEEMLKIYQQQQKSKSNNQQANNKNQKTNNNQQANNNAQPSQSNPPATSQAPTQPMCPGTQVIPPVSPTPSTNNPMQNIRQSNVKPSQSTQPTINQAPMQPMRPGTQVIPPTTPDPSMNNNSMQNNTQSVQPNQSNQPTTKAPTQPMCPGTQIIPPAMPANINMNNQSNLSNQNNILNNIQPPSSFQQPDAPIQNNNNNNIINEDEDYVPPARPRCPGTQVIPPIMPVNINMNNQPDIEPNAPMQDNNQQPMDEDDEYIPPTRPRCPDSQPVSPVIPADLLFKNNSIPSPPNNDDNNNYRFGQWNKPQQNYNSNPSIQSPSPPPSPFQGSIPVQLTPNQIPSPTQTPFPTPTQTPSEAPIQTPSQAQLPDLKSIVEEIFPEPVLPPFPIGETGGEYLSPTGADASIQLPADLDTGEGQLKVITRTASNAFPVKDAVVIVERVFPDGSTEVISSLRTNASGVSPTLSLPAPPKKYSMEKESRVLPFSYYDILVSASGFYKMVYKNVPIFDQVQSIQSVDMIPISLDISSTDRIVRFVDSGE